MLSDLVKSKTLLLTCFQIHVVVEISVIVAIEVFLGLIYLLGSRIHMGSAYFQVRRGAVATCALCVEEEIRIS